MTYYKSLDPARQATSPTFREGEQDGIEDALTASMCPPGVPHGPLQAGYMYLAGYEGTFKPFSCPCDGSCRDRARRDSPDVTEPK